MPSTPTVLQDVGMTTTADKSGARSLQLPDQLAVFRNLKNAKRFAIDIGGSLTKIAYYSTVSHKRAIYNADFQKNGSGSAGPEQRVPKEEQPAETDVETARLHFVKFETRHIEAWLRFVQERLVGVRQRALVGNTVKLTGGGAFKHRDLIASTLGLGVDMEDEMECLINGCNFLLKNITDEVFEYHRHGNPEYKFNNVDPNVFPYLLVNIGSGVSIMKVESEDKYERIGGSATGGGTFWGLGSLMTKAKSFDELLKLAEDGDHRSVDMLVKDIYGGNYNAMGLTSDLIACSFGKTIRFTSDNAFSSRDFSESDIARSLLFMISNDIGQIASLYALMHGLTRVYFGGYFLRGHPLSMHTVSFAINYWSKGKVRASFLRHEGYLGAIGAFLKGAGEYDTEKYSWGENYAGSSGLQSPIPAQISQHNSTMIDQLEMDRFDWQLVYCPLLEDPAKYLADTVDLTQDAEARTYWLQCFQDAIDKGVSAAVFTACVDMEDEMECLINGCNFLLKNITDEVFEYHRHGNPEYKFNNVDPNVFPYLLVNIGSGVSIMKVESEDKYERIGGSATGGGTFWGLGSLMTKAKSFDELLKLAEDGDHRSVDMLVKDIYGGNYNAMGLTSDLIACSFGKTIRFTSDNAFSSRDFSESDIARSLLFMISNDIGQIASLYALMHGLTRVYFGGYFLRGHPLSMHTVSFAINYWSKGKVRASFLRHEGYLGAIGAFLKGAGEYDTEKYSWGENYAGSSGLQSPIPAQISQHNSTMIDQLEMDRFDWQLVYCPLLEDPAKYLADTVDLTQDAEARTYWLQCFQDAIDKFVEVAVCSQPHKEDAPSRANQFKEKYLCRLQHLHEHPFAYGSLTVRSLLDMREHCLIEFDFPDPYFQQKRLENEAALGRLRERLDQLDSLGWRERQEALVEGLLAGNVFDWGAKEVALLLDGGTFGFAEAMGKLQGERAKGRAPEAVIPPLHNPSAKRHVYSSFSHAVRK
ncbi:4'-phosphopantetheine phosphatase [Ixodes scapularis]